jgi:hypothetical protein
VRLRPERSGCLALIPSQNLGDAGVGRRVPRHETGRLELGSIEEVVDGPGQPHYDQDGDPPTMDPGSGRITSEESI